MNGLDLLEPEVRKAVSEVLELGATASAVFDADGTLWPGDIGEDFLRELTVSRRLLCRTLEDPVVTYARLFADDPPRAFAFCVEVMRGLPLAHIERWSQKFFSTHFENRIFPGIRTILEAFQKAGVAIWLVSASSACTIRAAAAALGLEPSRVLAVDCPIDTEGRLTGVAVPPITCSAGKVEAIEAALGVGRPSIGFGNSLFDREMLEHSERAILVAPRFSDGPAVGLASIRGWPVHWVEP